VNVATAIAEANARLIHRVSSRGWPTEVHVTAGAFVYHIDSFCTGFIPLILPCIASHYGVRLGISILIGTIFGAVNFIFALLVGPETKGKVLDADLVLASVGLRFPMHPRQACLRRCRHASPVRRPTPRARSVK